MSAAAAEPIATDEQKEQWKQRVEALREEAIEKQVKTATVVLCAEETVNRVILAGKSAGLLFDDEHHHFLKYVRAMNAKNLQGDNKKAYRAKTKAYHASRPESTPFKDKSLTERTHIRITVSIADEASIEREIKQAIAKLCHFNVIRFSTGIMGGALDTVPWGVVINGHFTERV